MDSIFQVGKGKIFTVIGVDSVSISRKDGIDFMCDDESKNVLVSDEDKHNLDSCAGEIVRAFLADNRHLTDDELQAIVEVDLRPDGELVLTGIEDITNVEKDGWTLEDQEAEDFDEDGDIFEDETN